jgi:excinuclease ABC subunit A
LPQNALNSILYGSEEILKVKNEYLGVTSSYSLNFEGIINFINNQLTENSTGVRKWAGSFTNITDCPTCKGARLKNDSLNFRIDEKNIADLSDR